MQHNRGDYEFGHDFIITTSLRLAEVDFDLDLDDLYETWNRNGRKPHGKAQASSPTPPGADVAADDEAG